MGEEAAKKPQTNWLAFASIILGTFITVLNQSLVNVAIPNLESTFGSTPDQIEWVITGYMLASGIVIPVTGFMGERLGYKKFLIISLIVFSLGTILSAVAWSDTALIFARIIAGIGGGVISPISMALVYTLFPREKISSALSIWGVASMMAPAIGPTLGGYLIQVASWRYLFLISLPVSAICIMMVLAFVKETEIVKGKTFDIWGFIFCAIGCGTLLYALDNGQKDGWGSFEIVFLIYIALSCFLLFVYIETGKEHPLIPLSLFKSVRYTMSVIVSSLIMIGLYGGVFLMPIFLQNIQGMAAMDTGLLLMPGSICMSLVMMIVGKLTDKFGPIPLSLVGLSLLGYASFEYHFLTVGTAQSWIRTIYIIRCIAIGLCFMPVSMVGMNAIADIDKRQVGNASAVSNVVRQVSASFGIAILTMIMQNREAMHNEYTSELVTNSNVYLNYFFHGASGLSHLSGLILQDSMTRGIADAFEVSALPIFCAIPLLIFFRKKKANI